MILDTLLISLVLALVAGGRLANLAKIDIRHTWLVFVAVIINYGGQWLYDQGAQWIGASPVPYLLSLAAVLAFVWLNRNLPGFLVAGAGILCNVIVIVANGGRMPVSLDAVHRAGLDALSAPLINGSVFTHAPMSADIRLGWLGDVFALPRPYPRPKVLSIGDIILAIGVFWFVASTLRPWPLRQKEAVSRSDEPHGA